MLGRKKYYLCFSISSNSPNTQEKSTVLYISNVMKKILSILAILLFSSFYLSAQNALEVDGLSEHGFILVGRFGTSSDLSYKDRSVRVLQLKSRNDLCIGYLDDMGGNINLKYLRIEGPDWAAFEEKMAVINEKFTKWTQTAKANGEKGFKKTIPVDFENKVGKFYLGFSDGYYDTELYAVFEVDSNGDCSLRLDDRENYDSRSSSFKDQMHTPFFVFRSPEAFTVLYELIKQENALATFASMQAKIDAKKKAEEDHNAMYD